MTRAGFTALEAELKHLKSEERPAIIQAIAEARELGDLKENAEYHSAREKQGFIEGRITELEGDPRPRRRDRPGHAVRRDQVRRDRDGGRRGDRRGKDLADRGRTRG
jgi:hypothetical protein